MNTLIKVANQTPIEIALGIDGEGKTTAKKLYEFLELNPSNYSKWYKTNILENQFATENEDYIVFVPKDENPLGGRPTQDFKLSASFAKKLSMTAKNERGEQARQYFVQTEDKLKEIAISEQHLSPELQMFKQIFNAAARQEIEIKQIREQNQKVAEQSRQVIETTQNIKDTIVGTYDNWRDWVKQTVSKIQRVSGKTYQEIYTALYEKLEKRAKCRLSVRVDNQRKRMALDGATKTNIESYRTLDAIEDDQRLREIFSTVVKEYAIKYVA